MTEFEFFGLENKPNDKSSSDCVSEGGSFLDNIDMNEFLVGRSSKKLKKAKKAKKSTKKHKKEIKQLSYKTKDLKREVSALKGDVKNLKKSAYGRKLAELVNCDSVTERKRLAAELYRMEV